MSTVNLQELMPNLTRIHNEFDNRGWAIIRNLVSEENIQSLRDSFDYNQIHNPPSSGILYTHSETPIDGPGMEKLMTQWFNPHKYECAGSTLSVASSVSRVVSEFLCFPAVLFQDILMKKNPGNSPFEWHQDFPFWPVDSPEGLILWVPLQNVNEMNGGLGFADASHLDGPGPSIDLHTGQPQPGTEGLVPSGLIQITPELNAGDGLIFSPLIWHRSGPNLSTRPRLAWSSTWLNPEARWNSNNAPNHPLVDVIEDGDFVSGSLF